MSSVHAIHVIVKSQQPKLEDYEYTTDERDIEWFVRRDYPKAFLELYDMCGYIKKLAVVVYRLDSTWIVTWLIGEL